jgi:hypothetical protein
MMDSADWDAHGMAHQRGIHNRVRLMKLVHNILPTINSKAPAHRASAIAKTVIIYYDAHILPGKSGTSPVWFTSRRLPTNEAHNHTFKTFSLKASPNG